MFRKIALVAASILALTVGGAQAAGSEGHVEDIAFAHEGPFGKFDQVQLLRGLKVYTEVCSSCHGLKFVAFRTLADEGGPMLPKDQMEAYAATYTITDAETAEDRPGQPTDHFPHSAMENAPDLSLMAKGRAGFHGPYGTGINQLTKGMGGPEYIYSVLTGYTGEEKEEFGTVFYENKAFRGGWIAMPPPLEDDTITYDDGHPSTQHDLAEDVSSFLMWTAEPKLMARREAGLVSVVFLVLLAGLLYLTNKRIWSGIKDRKTA
jgi:ubiquinol-cytochrome c reductase cytochrome c1 subunit